MNLIDVLAAEAPASGLELYGRLVGTWDVNNRYRSLDSGEWTTGTAVWTFGWVLDGLAVQDVMWFTDRAADGYPVRRTGSTMRLYDPGAGRWHVVWFSPRGQTVTLTGRPGPDGGIEQEGRRLDGTPVRWTFEDVTAESFRWLGYTSPDDGTTWDLEQEMLARRRAG